MLWIGEELTKQEVNLMLMKVTVKNPSPKTEEQETVKIHGWELAHVAEEELKAKISHSALSLTTCQWLLILLQMTKETMRELGHVPFLFSLNSCTQVPLLRLQGLHDPFRCSVGTRKGHEEGTKPRYMALPQVLFGSFLSYFWCLITRLQCIWPPIKESSIILRMESIPLPNVFPIWTLMKTFWMIRVNLSGARSLPKAY